MSRHSKALAALTLGVAIVMSGLVVTRHVTAVAEQADRERLNRVILEYIAEKNPQAPIRAFRRFPDVLRAEAQRTNIDHCLALVQAEVESEFRQDMVGAAGEVGIYQILPSTAALLEPVVGRFRRPNITRTSRDLGDLADPVVSTRFAMAYLRDIMTRRPTLRDALTEYNGGPAGRHLAYYRAVMGAYVEILDREELGCRYHNRIAPRQSPLLTVLART
jgi:soluble lytic murein transglycosylase-like protein